MPTYRYEKARRKQHILHINRTSLGQGSYSKILGCLLSLICFVSCCVAEAQGVSPELIFSSSFEEVYGSAGNCSNVKGLIAFGWEDNTCWNTDRPEVQYARDNDNPHSGSSSQRVTLQQGAFLQLAHYLEKPINANTSYTISLWLRAEGSVTVSSILRKVSEPYTNYVGKMTVVGPNWELITFKGFMEASDGVLLINISSPGTFWIDDVAIVTKTEEGKTISPPSTIVSPQFFGMHLNHFDTQWPNVGTSIGAIRIWDAAGSTDNSIPGSQWSEINPSPGVYRWEGLDARVEAAISRGADVLYTLGGRTPASVALHPKVSSPYGDGECDVPRTDALWREWIWAIAERYKGKIFYWEIWNEPDLQAHYCGTPEQLVNVARSAYEVLKAVDSRNQVLTPGFNGYGGPQYLDRYLELGGGNYADIIAYHFYDDRTPEEGLVNRLRNIRIVLEEHGQLMKPLWNTEQGWIDFKKPGVGSQGVGAALLARSYLLQWANGISRFYFYTWDNVGNEFPTVEPDGITPTRFGTAYGEVAKWMVGRVMSSISKDLDETYTITLITPSNTLEHVIWNAVKGVDYSVPADWGTVTIKNLVGQSSAFPINEKLRVDASPLLISP